MDGSLEIKQAVAELMEELKGDVSERKALSKLLPQFGEYVVADYLIDKLKSNCSISDPSELGFKNFDFGGYDLWMYRLLPDESNNQNIETIFIESLGRGEYKLWLH